MSDKRQKSGYYNKPNGQSSNIASEFNMVSHCFVSRLKPLTNIHIDAENSIIGTK